MNYFPRGGPGYSEFMAGGTPNGDDDFDGEEDYSAAGEPEYHPEADDPGDFWCPKCAAPMFGDATLCSKCGDYVTPGAKPSHPMPWWVWAGLAGVALTFFFLLTRGCR